VPGDFNIKYSAHTCIIIFEKADRRTVDRMRRKRGHVRMRGEWHWLGVFPLTTSAETSDSANRSFLLYRTYTLTWFHHRRFANISEDQKASVLIPRKPQRPVDFLRKPTAICPGLVYLHVSWSSLQGPWHWSGLNTYTRARAFLSALIVFWFFAAVIIYPLVLIACACSLGLKGL